MRSIIYGNTYNGYELNYTSKNDDGFYVTILQKIEPLLGYMISNHNQVFFTMFVLKYPSASTLSYPNDNVVLSRFLEAFILHCRRRQYDPNYLWVRECSNTGQVHYHLLLLLDADYIQNAHGLQHKATELWQRCLNIEDGRGLVHLCKTGGYDDRYGGVKIRRNAPDFHQVYAACFQRASYLAKCHSKGKAPAFVNELGCSRLS